MSTKDPALHVGRASERLAVDPSDAAGLGSTVEVADLATGAQLTYGLVEVHGAAPEQRHDVDACPVGAALRAPSCR
jgi:transcription elongation GreA/GreB family factor